MRINISDRQLDQDLQGVKKFHRFYLHFDQNYMQSLIRFILRFNFNFQCVLIILYEYRCIADKCSLNRAANLLPRIFFVIELESYG